MLLAQNFRPTESSVRLHGLLNTDRNPFSLKTFLGISHHRP